LLSTSRPPRNAANGGEITTLPRLQETALGAIVMRKFTMILSLLIVAAGAQQALAIAQFQAQFMKEYINEHPDKEFQKYVKTKARCHICHQGKVTPKNVHHNAYGKHLVKLLDPKTDKKDFDKMKKAFAEVAKMHSDPKDEKSPTYGDLIKQSKLPGGKLEDSQKEPAEEAAAPPAP
jgi:hypothetical protein